MKKNILLVIIVISFILIIFVFCNYKINFLGNNSNKTTQDIANDILNIKSYYATLTVSINSNKNTNEYKIKQEVADNKSVQEVIENDDCKIRIINDENTLMLQNTALDTQKVYKNYKFLIDSQLCLTTFVKDYKQSDTSRFYEENDGIIFETEVVNVKNKYISTKKLYVEKSSGKILKMEIFNNEQNRTIYILYNEIEFNN